MHFETDDIAVEMSVCNAISRTRFWIETDKRVAVSFFSLPANIE